MNESVILENVKLDQNRMHISGKATPTNSAGSRNFSIEFNLDNDEELVDELISRNWPVKKYDPLLTKDGKDTGRRIARLKVNINYKFRPPRFEMLLKAPAFDKQGNQLFEDEDHKKPYYFVRSEYLDEEESKIIDEIDISDVDLALNLSTYKKMDGTGEGYCVYLKEMRFTKVNILPQKKSTMDVLQLRPDLKDIVADCPFDIN